MEFINLSGKRTYNNVKIRFGGKVWGNSGISRNVGLKTSPPDRA